MRKIFPVVFVILFTASAFADWISEAKTLVENQIEPLAADLGSALSGGLAEPVKNGELLGFDIGVKTSFAGISDETKNNFSSLKNEDFIPAAWIYASKGIFGFDIFARFSSLEMHTDDKLTLWGAGVFYTVVEDKLLKVFPGVAAFASFNTLSATDVSAKVNTFGVTLSKKFPVVTPFATVAVDRSSMEVETGLVTLKPKETTNHISLGFEVRLIPLAYINAAYSLSSGVRGFQLGIGIKN